MKSIRIKDLEIIEKEKEVQEIPQKNFTESLAELAIENKKKDVLITQLTQAVTNLNIEITKLKGGTGNE